MEEGKSALIGASQEVADLRLLLPTLREITEIKKLTPTLVNTLIEWIEVHNNDKSSGHSYVKADVYLPQSEWLIYRPNRNSSIYCTRYSKILRSLDLSPKKKIGATHF